MNAKSLAFAIALVAGTGFASAVHASGITTLETVQVRPSADQIAQATHEANSSIPTLAAVQVRPTVGQIVELMAEQAASRLAANTPVAIGANVGQWIVSLPAVNVRPDLEQVQAKAVEMAAGAVEGVVVQSVIAK